VQKKKNRSGENTEFFGADRGLGGNPYTRSLVYEGGGKFGAKLVCQALGGGGWKKGVIPNERGRD